MKAILVTIVAVFCALTLFAGGGRSGSIDELDG